MFVTIVNVSVKNQFVDEFVKACQLNHEQSIQETGNMRFDILQSADDPTQFVLYEAYDNEQSAVAHKDTAHYLKWRETVADWMAQPRSGTVFNGLYPE